MAIEKLIMKLISNTLFGKYCKSKEKEFKTRLEYLEWYEKTRNNFDEFLEQPLKLERFVPCDEDGEILDEPRDYEQRLPNMMTEYNDEVYTYYQAKVKVLFEGFELVRFIDKENPCYVVSNGENEVTFHIGLYNFSKGVNFAKTIEDLIHIQPILTESAIKQIGL